MVAPDSETGEGGKKDMNISPSAVVHGVLQTFSDENDFSPTKHGS